MEKRRIYKIPVGNKKWYEFWKKSPKVEIKEIMRTFQEKINIDDIEFKESQINDDDIWKPVEK